MMSLHSLSWLHRLLDGDEEIWILVPGLLLWLCLVAAEAGLWWWACLQWRTRASQQRELGWGAVIFLLAAAFLLVGAEAPAMGIAVVFLAPFFLPLGVVLVGGLLALRYGAAHVRRAARTGAGVGMIWAAVWLHALGLIFGPLRWALALGLVGLCICGAADRARFDRLPGSPPLDLAPWFRVPPRQG